MFWFRERGRWWPQLTEFESIGYGIRMAISQVTTRWRHFTIYVSRPGSRDFLLAPLVLVLKLVQVFLRVNSVIGAL